jgi:DNA-binding LacI/PurR family transcriptional regulator
MSGRGPVTLKKVAERAGVSMMTVSLALRDNCTRSRVSEATRKRILEAVQELDYRPNARARALRSGHTNVIGLYAGYGYINVRLPFFTELVSGLQEGGEQFKKDLLLHGVFHGSTDKDIFNELADGRIDGLIVNMSADNPMAERLAEAHLPVVAVADALPGIPSIVVDDIAGSQRIVQHLQEHGYQHVLYLSSGLHAVSAIRRYDAFLEAAVAADISVENIDPAERTGSDNWFRNQLEALHHRTQRTAIVCWNDFTAFGALASCQQHGLRVPEDVAVIGFDGCPTPFDNVWSLTTVRAPWAQAAYTAVSYLDTLLKGETVPNETILPVEFIPGHTT